ncbi:hypothetical protein SFUMM280S_07840 [Streptomyces fumanus]
MRRSPWAPATPSRRRRAFWKRPWRSSPRTASRAPGWTASPAVGCDKNLLYVYFGNKEALFTTVLERSLARVYEEIEFTPDDLPGYATAVFDFAMTTRT